MSEVKTTAKERVEIEYRELKDRYDKLSAFIDNRELFDKNVTNKEQRALLLEQMETMENYCLILARRLEIWDN